MVHKHLFGSAHLSLGPSGTFSGVGSLISSDSLFPPGFLLSSGFLSSSDLSSASLSVSPGAWEPGQGPSGVASSESEALRASFCRGSSSAAACASFSSCRHAKYELQS